MTLRIELPEVGVDAKAILYWQRAPELCQAIYDSVRTPLETRTSHACFDGHEIYCFLPPFPRVPELCNRTMRPQPGEMMFFYAQQSDFAFLEQDRLAPVSGAMHELAFIYGEADLRHFWEEGLHGSLIGRITEGYHDFSIAAANTLNQGSTAIRIEQA